MGKEDMRTKRTKKALKQAIIKLMMNESIEKISVTDICEEAEINRVTFYSHYKDKFDLLHELLSDITKTIDAENKKYYLINKTGDQIRDFTNTISHSIYKVCFQNKALIKSLSRQENTVFVEMIEEIIIKNGLETFELLKNTLDIKYPPKFIINFLLGGFSKLIFDYALAEEDLSEKEFFEHFDQFFYSLMKSKIFF